MSNEYTREWWKERLHLIQAFAEGRNVEVYSTDSTNWHTLPLPCFDENVITYRIAPDPKLRPWKPEEVPVSALFKNIGTGTIYYPISQSAVGTVRLLGSSGTTVLCYEYGPDELFGTHLNSTDGGKTWHPCGMMEEQP